MRVEPVVGRPAAHDLEAVPLIEAMLATAISAVIERQAAKAARSRHLVNPLQTASSRRGALLPRSIAIWWM